MNIFSNQIEYERYAQLAKKTIVCASFALSLCGLQTSYYDYLQEPTLGNELKSRFKQLGASEKIRKQEEILNANERRWAWKKQGW